MFAVDSLTKQFPKSPRLGNPFASKLVSNVPLPVSAKMFPLASTAGAAPLAQMAASLPLGVRLITRTLARLVWS
ncbi:MAG: hypothetical protein DME35_09075 [Verrucomicrobia bacterium]|nr:MAG: hypothetical protein DME35_09075 [Verrucomicrobiota bacterium]PYL29978.1 MAG: hypothetical protein DMF45_03765 [Verrucomicrobiota bacterium]